MPAPGLSLDGGAVPGNEAGQTPTRCVRCQRRDQHLISQVEPRKAGKPQRRSGFGGSHSVSHGGGGYSMNES